MKKICIKCGKEKNLKEFYKSGKYYFPRCKECHKQYCKEYKKEHLKEYLKEYQKTPEWKEYKRKYMKKRLKTDIDFRILVNLRRRLWCAIKNNQKSGKTLELLGCSIFEFKEYFKSLFSKSMTWDNYGEWEIDHKIPCSSFDLSKALEQKKCFHYTNLQPLWAKDNMRKSNKYEKAA